MAYEGTTIDDLKERGTHATVIIIESKERGTSLSSRTENKERSIDIFLENKKGIISKIAENIDFVDINGITKNNDIYYMMMVGEGKLYVDDNILYQETVEERFKTFIILIPIY